MAVTLHILPIVLGRLFKTLFKLGTLEHAATVYTNSGNLVIPLVMSVFGSQQVIYTSGSITVQAPLFWTHLRLLLCGSGRLSWKTALTNINILPILFGILLFACQIKLSRVIDSTLAIIGGMIGPIAMPAAGMLIASPPLKEVVLSKRIYLTAPLRLILILLILLLFAKVSGIAHLGGYSNTVVLISFLATVNPAVSTVIQMVAIYGQSARKASAIYGITTLFYVIIMSLMIGLYRLAA